MMRAPGKSRPRSAWNNRLSGASALPDQVRRRPSLRAVFGRGPRFGFTDSDPGFLADLMLSRAPLRGFERLATRHNPTSKVHAPIAGGAGRPSPWNPGGG